MPQSYTAIYHHFVFSTKDRVPIIDAALQTRLYEFIGGLCKNRNSRLLFAGGMPDQVHLLISLDKEWAPSRFMREIKGNSSKWIHETSQPEEFRVAVRIWSVFRRPFGAFDS